MAPKRKPVKKPKAAAKVPPRLRFRGAGDVTCFRGVPSCLPADSESSTDEQLDASLVQFWMAFVMHANGQRCLLQQAVKSAYARCDLILKRPHKVDNWPKDFSVQELEMAQTLCRGLTKGFASKLDDIMEAHFRRVGKELKRRIQLKSEKIHSPEVVQKGKSASTTVEERKKMEDNADGRNKSTCSSTLSADDKSEANEKKNEALAGDSNQMARCE